jgi:hypothetical protein
LVELRVILDDTNGAWPDLKLRTEDIIHLSNGAKPMQMAGLSNGMGSGAPSVAVRIDLPDGKVVIAETSLRLLLTAADILKARFGDPRL